MTSTADMFAQALRHHQAGDLRQAESLYHCILQNDPRHGDALHLLGVVAHQVGQHELAVQHIRRALDLIPGFAAAHNNLGNALRALGRLGEAMVCYREAIRLQPDYLEAHSNLGIVLRQQGQLDQAIAAYRQALRLHPDSAMVYNNLGNAWRDQGELHDAVACYEQALRLQPHYAEALNNLGIALQELGHTQQAAARFGEALRLKPHYAEAHNNFGVLLAGRGQTDEARVCYEQALELQADYVDAHRNLGLCLHGIGQLEAAAAQFREVLRLRPDDPTAMHLLSALTGSATPDRSSAGYVAALFDGYAGYFDEHLVKALGYRGPELLREALAHLGAAKALDILDLGCGTGLCGVAVRDWARKLTGVDLSPKMLAKAHARGVYDELKQVDLLVPLQAATQAFDLVVAGDVFAYLGDLDPVFQAASQALRPRGHMAFLVEAHDGEGQNYVLRTSGRFAHSTAYLRRLAEANRFAEISMKRAVARTDRGKATESLVVVVRTIFWP